MHNCVRAWHEYPSILFDCDGVLLNSNSVKTEAFRTIGRQFDSAAAELLVQYHVERGGISRQVKFQYFLETILGRTANENAVKIVCQQFSDEVMQGLLACEASPELERLRLQSSKSRWYVVSGGDQAELRQVFAERGMAQLFDGGIYGSPTPKIELVDKIKSDAQWHGPGLFLGDSRYDWQVAVETGLDFVFVSGWTEFSGWREFCTQNGIPAVGYLDELGDESDAVELLPGNTL